jgi:mono/diheme cytochrome c family protein
MKKLVVICFIICVAILYACNNDATSNASKYLNPNNLAVQSFTINTAVDNNIVTKQGIKISIAKGSIEAASQNVTLEIKEALSLDAMLKAGLTTQTKDGILSSEGMFYIATKEASTIKKPIAISVPTAFADTSMQLYKGKDNNGKIEWEAPTSLTTKASEKPNGRDMFKTNCAACHAIGKKLTGPGLEWIETNWPNKKLLYAYIRNNQAFLNGNVPDSIKAINEYAVQKKYACILYNDYGKTQMTLYPNLSNQELDELVSYIIAMSKKVRISNNAVSGYTYVDSCQYYNDLYAELTAKRDSLLIDETTQTDTLPNSSVINVNPFSSRPAYQTTVNPPKYNAEYYQFSIDSFGWYNVDALLKESANCVNSELQVTIKGEGTEQVHVYLLIPDKKVFIEGELLKDKNAFGFYDDNGKIPLPQGFTAFIIAHSEKSGKLYFGQTSILISLKQNLQLALKENTKEGILKAMESLKLDDMKMQIDSANPVVKSMQVLEEEAKAALQLSELATKEKKVDEINELLYKIQFKLAGCDCLSKQSGRLPKI